jgi:hypothetical protein
VADTTTAPAWNVTLSSRNVALYMLYVFPSDIRTVFATTRRPLPSRSCTRRYADELGIPSSRIRSITERGWDAVAARIFALCSSARASNRAF